MTTEFVLIRHGETAWNVELRYQGSSDIPLNDLGIRQAQALADSMRGEQWDVIVSSPLQRAWNTALPIAEAVGIDAEHLIPDPRLMERAFGVVEGLLGHERESQYPGDVWEGLESHAEVEARAIEAMEDYLKRYANKRIMMVAHGGWINSVLEVLSQGEFGYGKSVILNTSRTSISHDGEGWHVGDVAVAPHLEALID
jgi:uncharacterized phosphatase